MSESDDVGKSIFVALIGLFLGFLVAAFLSSPKTSICPVCKKTIKNGVKNCPYCGIELKW